MALGCQLGTILAPFWVPSWAMLGTKLVSNGLKWRFKKCFKKRSPATLKQHPINMPGGPWGAPQLSRLFEQETVVRATVEALFEILAEKVNWIRNRCNKN